MKIVTYIKNWTYLIAKQKRTPTFDTARDAYQFLYHVIGVAKRQKWNKRGVRRKLLCKIVKDLRTIHKQPINDYSEARKMYEQYFTLPNTIACFEELTQKIKFAPQPIYLYKFRDKWPVQGNKPHQYYINGSYGGIHKTYRCELNTKHNTVTLYNFKNEKGYFGLERDQITSYVYATQQQIDQFENNKTKYEMLSFQKANAQKVVENINTLINKIDKDVSND